LNPSTDLNVVDLFSGIGGFSLGLHRADPRFKTIAFCEIEPFCQEVLKQNFPGVTLYNDIKDTKINEPTFLVCGGFPCQGFSQAGLQRGTEDDRYLWGEMFDVIKHTQPRWVIAENVRGIVTTQDGLAFNTVHTDLESEGYEVQAFNIPAIGKGAWHKRERIWFIATNISNTYNDGLHRQKRNATEQSSNQSKDRVSIRNDQNATNTDSGEQFGCNDANRIYQTEQQRMVGNEKKDRNKVWSETERCSKVSGSLQDDANTDSIGTQIPIEGKFTTEQMSGSECEESWWQIESRLCGVPYGITTGVDKDRTKRLKALGNGVVPQIVEEIGRAIIKAEFGNG